MNVDAILFSDELDLLEIRLETLQDVVDAFLIVESPVTHLGKPKLLHFHENRKRFEKWMSKIWHHVYTAHPPACNNPTPWHRDDSQREEVRQYLIKPYIGDDDLITLCDADEIPNPEVFLTAPAQGMANLQMYLSYWFLNCRTQTKAAFAAKLVTGAYLKINTARDIRLVSKSEETRPEGGWHFAWCGSTERLLRKTYSYAHCNDADTPALREAIANRLRPGLDCETPTFPAAMVARVNVDSSFPKYVQEHEADLIEQGYILP